MSVRLLLAVALVTLVLLITQLSVSTVNASRRYINKVNGIICTLVVWDLFVLWYARTGEVASLPGFARAALQIPGKTHLALLITTCLHCIYGIFRLYDRSLKTLSKKSVIEAMNSMECGLLYSDESGNVVLMNRKMLKLSKIFTKRKILDAEDFWRSVISFDSNDRAKRIDFTTWPAFLLNSGEVWSFQRSYPQDSDKRYMEIVARNVTALYKKRLDLEAEIENLSKVEKDLAKVLKNISKAGNDEELLNYKIRIHDQLGNAILRTRQLLRSFEENEQDCSRILYVWSNTIRAFKGNRLEAEYNKAGSLEGLYKQAQILGIDLVMFGDFPVTNSVAIRAVRESMYNSIRHAYANTLTVESYKGEDGYHIHIYDDGKCEQETVSEGGGLKSLRRAVEATGGSMAISVRQGVELNLFFAEEEK